MEDFEKEIQQIKAVQGEPREGFEDFVKSCTLLQPFLSPTVFPSICKGYILPSGLYLSEVMIQPYYDSRTMIARDTDVLVDSYPKTGTTWTQEICYLILHDGNVRRAKEALLEQRTPFLEIPFTSIRNIENFPDPRLLKSHLPYEALPPSFIQKKTKIVYIARNPKDTAVSFYHFAKMLRFVQYAGEFGEFLDEFLAGRVTYSSFADHVLGYWNRRHQDNILFLTYEDLHQDFRGEVLKIGTFLGKTLSEEQLDKIQEHCSFETMSKNPMTNYSMGMMAKAPNTPIKFMRKGKIGDWKNYFTDEMNQKMDAYVKHHFEGTGLNFKFDN